MTPDLILQTVRNVELSAQVCTKCGAKYRPEKELESFN